MRKVFEFIRRVAPTESTVLVQGESGTGKELVAHAIHRNSPRADKPFVAINCAAIADTLLESELFGHKKGSFTGAMENRKGYFEIADEGTLVLDEIAEMPLTTQVKLLRVIETKEFMRIGAETVTKVDVRIIAATNKDLQKEVDSKRFREDLFFRLKAVTFNIPPLRKRKGDIEEFAMFFLKSYSEGNHITTPRITNEAMEILKNYSWPGNIRELKNAIETAIALNKNGILDEFSFIPLLREIDKDIPSQRNLPVFLNKTPEDADRELMYRALFEIKKDLIELKDLIYHRQEEISNNDEIISLADVEKNAMIKALEKTHGNKRMAARLLNISERTFYRKMKGYEI
jgi:transcriptional regulator with PAS, ATPase and Fis domain